MSPYRCERDAEYMLLDGTSGKPAGIYDPVNRLGPFQFQGVDVSGMVAARLSLNAYFNTISHVANATWGLTVRFNGGPWRNRFLTPTEVDAINTPGSAGNMAMLLDVPLGDLVGGVNTLELLPLNAPMDYPPVVANIDLTLSPGTATAPTAPTNLRIRS